jgi:hypothetical protein
MKLWLSLFLTLLTVVPALADARMAFDTKELTFPSVREGQTITAEFPFTNLGNANLEIVSINNSCGCTTAEYSRSTAPGQRGMVRLALDTSDITGAFRKTSVVKTNDPANPIVTLVMVGETQSRIKVDLGRRIEIIGCQGETNSVTATLSDVEGKTLVLAGVENPMSQYLDAKLSPQPGSREYQLILTVKSAEPIEFAGPVFLIVPGSAKMSIYVVVEVRSTVTVQPNEVHFGTISQSNSVVPERTILVRKACIDNFVFEAIGFNSAYFSVREVWTKLGETVNLVLTPKAASLPLGTLDEKITIQAGGRMQTIFIRGNVVK